MAQTILSPPRQTVAPMSHWLNTGAFIAPLAGNQPLTFHGRVLGVVSTPPPTVGIRTATIVMPAPAPMKSQQIFLLNMAGVSKMTEPQSEKAMPAHLYVDVATITKTASVLVFVICLFSITIGIFTGFNIVQPFAAILIGFSSTVFFVMGIVLKREWSA